MPSLASLGRRIVILGTSNAGKSTLAVALSQKLGVPVVHLDQLRHFPNSDWEPRPDKEFAALHDEAIQGEAWVMEGSYSKLMPQCFDRATGPIVITSNRWLRLFRYLKRTLLKRAERAGHLEGGTDRIKWNMVDWILFRTPNRAVSYARKAQAADLPLVTCSTAMDLNRLYRDWGLQLPSTGPK